MAAALYKLRWVSIAYYFSPTDELSVTLGAGLGAGVAAIGGVGVQAGRTEGFTTKTTAGGGFGGAGSASLGFSEEGVNASATVGAVLERL